MIKERPQKPSSARKVVRWVGKATGVPDVENSGETWKYHANLGLAMVSQFSKSLTKIREVLYKGKSKGLRIDSVGVYITEVVKNNRKPEAAMVVIEKLVNEAYIKSPWTLCCMIIGGFLTTERWLAEAITKKARPTGLFYPGLLKLKTRLKIHVCACADAIYLNQHIL